MKVFLELTLLFVFSEILVKGQDALVATLGNTVLIKWTVQDTKDSINNFVIFVNTTEDRDQLLTTTLSMTSSGSFSFGRSSKEMMIRTSARYSYIGNQDGMFTGEITLTIKKVHFSDSGLYVLRKQWTRIKTTRLDVSYGPKNCGRGLKSKYIAKAGECLPLIIQFCGKPQPTVVCTFDGKVYNSSAVIMSTPYKYNYLLIIPTTNLQRCEEKELICNASGHGDAIIQRSFVSVESSIPVSHLAEKVKFSRDCSTCSVSWESNIDIGNCHVCYGLQFMNGTNITTIPACINETNYDCSEQSEYESVRVITHVHGLKKFTNNTSSFVQRNDTICPSTTASLDTHSRDAENKTFQSKQKQGLNYQGILVIAFAVVIVTLLLSVVVLIVKYTRKSKALKENDVAITQPMGEMKLNESNFTTTTSASHYVELQLKTAPKDATYQTLTSITETTTKQSKDTSQVAGFQNDAYQSLS